MRLPYAILFTLLLLSETACVPSKKYKELLEQQQACNEELEKYKTRALDAEDQLKNAEVKLKQANKELDKTNKQYQKLDEDHKKLKEY